MKSNSPLMLVKVNSSSRRMCFTLSYPHQASLTTHFIQQALGRDRQCIFSGVLPSCDTTLVATWVFPPFLGYEASVHNISMLIISAIPFILISCVVPVTRG